MEGPLSAQRLQAAADQLRADWVSTRLAAMRSGEPHIFRFEPGTPEYVLEPYQLGAIAQATTSAGVNFGSAPPAVNMSTPSLPVAPRWRTLPDEARFAAAQTANDARATSLFSQQGWAVPTGSNGGNSAAMGMQGGAAILFYPDGTTTSATVVLAGENENHIELRLRGLTGIVTTSEVFRAADMLAPSPSQGRRP